MDMNSQPLFSKVSYFPTCSPAIQLCFCVCSLATDLQIYGVSQSSKYLKYFTSLSDWCLMSWCLSQTVESLDLESKSSPAAAAAAPSSSCRPRLVNATWAGDVGGGQSCPIARSGSAKCFHPPSAYDHRCHHHLPVRQQRGRSNTVKISL